MQRFLSAIFHPARLGLALILAVCGCDSGSFKETGKEEQKTVVPFTNNASLNRRPPQPIAHARYQVKVNAGTGMELCSGVMEMILSQDFDLSPTGVMKCLLIGDMDLNKIFGSSQNYEKQDVDMRQFPMFGRIVRTQNPVALQPGLEQFNPPVGRILGPIVQNAEIFRDFTYSEPAQVSGISKEGESFQGQGSWFYLVHEIGASHRPIDYRGAMEFNNIMRWEVKAAGFEGTPKIEFMAFDSMMYYWNTNPIAVPEIVIKGKLSELTAANGSNQGGILGGIGDVILSGITIRITLLEQNPI